MNALERIESEYQRRDEQALRTPSLGDQYMIAARDLDIAKILVGQGFSPASKVLDIGCGGGAVLRRLPDFGFAPENLTGLEFLANRARAARSLGLQVVRADASRMPFRDEVFDLAIQMTAFSSMPTPEMRTESAQEVARVLRPGGAILWYDFFVNPVNRETHPIGKRELLQLFPGWEHTIWRTTLAPPLTRKLAPKSWKLCAVLESIPWLRTHYLAILSRPA